MRKSKATEASATAPSEMPLEASPDQSILTNEVADPSGPQVAPMGATGSIKLKFERAAAEAPETAEKPIPAPTMAIADEAFDVRPSETVSIVAGNRVLFLGKGLRGVTIIRND